MCLQSTAFKQKFFPVLKFLLIMIFCGMVIEGVNCEISFIMFIPQTKEFHWFNDFVVIFTV